MGSYIVRERGEPAVAAVRQAPVTEGEYQPGTTVSALAPIDALMFVKGAG
jgi:hypothetical protein